MKLYTETDLHSFEAWSGAVEMQKKIIAEDKAADFEAMIEELYPEGLSETQLNDILWFEDAWLTEALDLTPET